jgi:hypothetical protein
MMGSEDFDPALLLFLYSGKPHGMISRKASARATSCLLHLFNQWTRPVLPRITVEALHRANPAKPSFAPESN